MADGIKNKSVIVMEFLLTFEIFWRENVQIQAILGLPRQLRLDQLQVSQPGFGHSQQSLFF